MQETPAPHSSQDIAAQKAGLRQQMLQQRLNIPGATARIAAQAVARHFADHPILAFKQTIAIYMPMRGELDVTLLAEHMRDYRKTICLPRIDEEAGILSFHEWAPEDTLERHRFGHQQPVENATEHQPDIILAPLLAFDNTGVRLGYGGGYYDKTLNQLQKKNQASLYIGVAFAMQEVAALSPENHDATLDGIITEQGVSFFGDISRHL